MVKFEYCPILGLKSWSVSGEEIKSSKSSRGFSKSLWKNESKKLLK